MTEIREYRGKRVDNGEWVYGGAYREPIDEVKFGHSYIIGGSLNNVGCAYEVDPSTIGQFAGLTDENGAKIFEGDILRNVLNEMVDKNPFEIVWEDGAWNWKDENGQDLFYQSIAKTCEVIGNIHDKEGK